MWNVFERNPPLRTTNNCEGWNDRQKSIPKHLRFLKIQEVSTKNQIAHMERTPTTTSKKKMVRIMKELKLSKCPIHWEIEPCELLKHYVPFMQQQ